MSTTLRRQADRFYRVFAELVRGYQFRDREGICCHGLSVSQCYSLEAVYMNGPMTMGELASHLYLELSTVTRIVDSLVTKGLANRAEDAKDRRVCRVRLTRKGRSLVTKIRGELVKEHEAVLRAVPSESREAVISAMSDLLSVFIERQPPVSVASKMKKKTKHKAG
jgi:DNA-binding MarR family transcriptional regulator